MSPGPNLLEAVGAQPSEPSALRPLFHNRFKTGLWTQRNPLRDPSGVQQERWFGGGTDALLDGVNVEITNRLTLARSCGTSKYSTAQLPDAPGGFYAFKTFTTANESIDVVVDTPSEVLIVNPTAFTALVAKTPGSGQMQFLGINGVLYMGDGIDTFSYSRIGDLQNYGLSPSTFNHNSGLPVSSVNGGGSGTAWSNPGNAGTSGGSYASATLAAGASSQTLQCTQMTFVPGFQNGPIVAINASVQVFLSGAGKIQLTLQLLQNGIAVGQPRTMNIVVTSPTTFQFGGSIVLGANFFYPLADLWGVNWTWAAVNSSGFGVQLTATNLGGGSNTINVNSVSTRAGSSEPRIPTTTAGSLSPATGYKYVQMYGSSARGVASVSTPPSALIKPVAQGVSIPLSASPDPQCDLIWLLRTKDGGSVYYNLPTSPYSNAFAGTVTDNATDDQLNLLQLADLPAVGGGQALNLPPPYGIHALEFHLGRAWGAVGNVVYYTAGSDLGLILGNGNEAWPAANFFTFPSQVTRLVSVSTIDQSFLLVFTVSDVYAIYGNASAIGVGTGVSGLTQFYAVPFLKRVGLSNYYGIDMRGTQIYMFTSDARLIRFNPSSQVVFLDPEKAIEEIGFPIGAPPPGLTLVGGTLANFNPATTFVTWHGSGSADQALYIADPARTSPSGPGWFRCNINQQPDGGICWSPFRAPSKGCTALQSIETAPGVFNLLLGGFAAGHNFVYKRDASVFTDDGVAYLASATFGAFTLAQPGQIAHADFITADFVKVGTQPVIGVSLNELNGAFTSLNATANDPPHLPAPTTVTSSRYHLSQSASGTQGTNACRFMQLAVNFGTDAVQNEMLSMTIFGGYEQEH